MIFFWPTTLLLAARVESAYLRDAQALAPDAPVSKDTHESVDAMKSKLARIVSGLGSVQQTQKNTEFAKMISPYVESMAKVLQEVHTSSSLSEKEKREKLEHAQDSMNNLANDMASFGQHLIDDQRNQQTSILLGVLLSRKDESMDRQMEVLTDKQFKHLDCVKYVLSHKTNAPLVDQVAGYLDSHKQPDTKVPAVAHPAPAQAPTPAPAALTDMKQKQVKPAQATEESRGAGKENPKQNLKTDHLTAMKNAMGAIHSFQQQIPEAKEDMKLNELTNVLTKAIDVWNEKKDVVGASDPEEAKLAAHVVDALNRARVELLEAEVRHLKGARELLKSGNVEGMQKALDQSHNLRNVLQTVFDELQHSGLVHGKQAFLQFNSFGHSLAGDCPYCKAQCIEKCHNEGHSFASCLGTCAEEGK